MKIDTIAEVHPLNILEGFMCLGLLGHGEQNDLSARFFGKESSHIKDPAAITSDVFWRSYASECRRLMVQCKEKSEHTRVLDEPTFEEVINLASGLTEIAKAIILKQASILASGGYKKMFIGGKEHPLAQFAGAHGISSVFLDYDNKHYDRIGRLFRASMAFGYRFSVEIDQNQVLRERQWIETIAKHISGESLLNVGGKHIDDEYGFRTELRKNGIELKVIEDFSEMDERGKALLKRIREKMQVNWI